MSSKYFTALLQRQIEMFIATFQDDGNELFKKDDSALIHPGEYGMYREQCFRNLLQLILPRENKVSDGFVISSKNDRITTQCDILVQNAFAMPLTDGGLGKFHPVEDIYAIVEMKSNLSKADLKEALRKLAECKMIGDDRKNKRRHQETRFLNHDAISTFLVCNKLTFKSIAELDFDDIYSGIDRKYWHNAFLSLDDGMFSYQLSLSDLPIKTKAHYKEKGFNVESGVCDYQYSQHIFYFPDGSETYSCPVKYVKATSESKYNHIMLFLSALKQAIDETVKYEFDSIEYLGLRSGSLR